VSWNRDRTGESYGDLIILGPDESGHGYKGECLGKSGQWHQAVYSGLLLDSGSAHCKDCADLEKSWESRRKRYGSEQTAMLAGLSSGSDLNGR
jgi:hypothetical protein